MATTDPLINPCVDEIEVATILLEFSQFVSNPFSWGRKRKRSAFPRHDDDDDDSTATATAPVVQPSPSPVSAMGPFSDATVKPEASDLSPDTPLSFSPSTESDEKEKAKVPRRKAKVSIKKRREELLNNLDDLTQCNESLVLEINNARNRYELVKQDNLRLKQVVRSRTVAVEPHLEVETRKSEAEEAITFTAERWMDEDRTADMVRWQPGVVDLNLSVEEAAARERLNGKARAAQARFYRRLKMKKCRSIDSNNNPSSIFSPPYYG